MADRAAYIEAETVLSQPYDTSDREQVNNARKKDGQKKRARLATIAGIMDIKEGRAWVYSLLDICHIFQTPFIQGDPHATSFRCGEHNVGLRILSEIQEAAPSQYITMIEESKGRV